MTNPKEHSRLWKLLAVAGAVLLASGLICWAKKTIVCAHLISIESWRVQKFCHETIMEDKESWPDVIPTLIEKTRSGGKITQHTARETIWFMAYKSQDGLDALVSLSMDTSNPVNAKAFSHLFEVTRYGKDFPTLMLSYMPTEEKVLLERFLDFRPDAYPDEALPVIDNILGKTEDPEIKERASFILFRRREQK